MLFLRVYKILVAASRLWRRLIIIGVSFLSITLIRMWATLVDFDLDPRYSMHNVLVEVVILSQAK